MTELGHLSKVELRELWQSESADFTPWLADNLDHLSDLLGLELELDAREAPVGDFSVDLVGHDLGRDRVVIIENQLERTDHTHLGQIITYAAAREAGVVIWISPEFRDEHRQALDWLNRVHEGRTEFFGVVVEALQIDGSKPAINFRLVAFPSQWSRTGPCPVAALSPKRLAYRDFFQGLLDVLRDQHKFTNARVAQPQNWYSFSSGVGGFQWSFSFAQGGRARTELYIDTPDEEQNLQILEGLAKDKKELERSFGEPLEWERLEERRACRVACYRDGDIEAPSDKLEEIRAWAVDRLLRFKRVFGPRLRDLIKP